MCEDDPAFSIGELNAKVDMILREQKAMRQDLDSLIGDRDRLRGAGAAVWIVFMSIGFLFGDTIRGLVKKLLSG